MKHLQNHILLTAYGIYAKDSSNNEVLYGVASVTNEGNGAYMPIYNGITLARSRT